ncbi:hypothetical protein [Cupriavidus basilensis]
MAKATTNAAGAKPDTTTAGAATDASQLDLGAGTSGAAGEPGAAGQGGTPPADAAGTVQLNTDTTAVTPQPKPDESVDDPLAGAVSDVKEAAAEVFPAARQTLREAVSSAAADAAKAGEHATHGVLNAIEVKLAELRNTIAASQSQVAEEYRHVLDWFENLL